MTERSYFLVLAVTDCGPPVRREISRPAPRMVLAERADFTRSCDRCDLLPALLRLIVRLGPIGNCFHLVELGLR